MRQKRVLLYELVYNRNLRGFGKKEFFHMQLEIAANVLLATKLTIILD